LGLVQKAVEVTNFILHLFILPILWIKNEFFPFETQLIKQNHLVVLL